MGQMTNMSHRKKQLLIVVRFQTK